MVTEENYTIRAYRDDDEKGINTLFNKVFIKSRTLDEWEWKFKKNPVAVLSLSNIITVLSHGDTIVGHYASWPMKFKYKDKIVKVAQPVDHVIDKESNVKIDKTIALFSYHTAHIVKGNFGFGFGLPNESAYFLGKRILNYKDISQIYHVFRRLNLRLAVKKKLPWLPSTLFHFVQKVSNLYYKLKTYKDNLLLNKSITIRLVEYFDSRINTFWEKVKDEYGVIVVSDEKYLNWRYTQKPGDKYSIFIAEKNDQIVGFVVVKIKEGEQSTIGYLIELISMRGVESILINTAVNFFLDNMVDYAICRVLREDRLYTSLVKNDFYERKDFPPMPVVYQIGDEDVDEGYLKDPGNWHITFGTKDEDSPY